MQRMHTRLESGARDTRGHAKLLVGRVSEAAVAAAARYVDGGGDVDAAAAELLRVVNAELGTECARVEVDWQSDRQAKDGGGGGVRRKSYAHGSVLLACGGPRLATVERRAGAPEGSQPLPRGRLETDLADRDALVVHGPAFEATYTISTAARPWHPPSRAVVQLHLSR